MEKRYHLYLVLFLPSALNRETAFFLIGVFAATQWENLGWRRRLRWAGVQLAVRLVVFVSLRLMIHPDGGDPVEFHVLDNLDFLMRGYGLGFL